MTRINESSDFQSQLNDAHETNITQDRSISDHIESNDEFKTPFKCFIHNEQENTMQYFCNEIYDNVFDFSEINESDYLELETFLNDFCNDKLFNSFILKLFNKENNCYSFKTSIQNTSKFPIISVRSAQAVLNDVFKSTNNTTIKKYILFLTVSVEKLFEDASEKFAKLGIYNGAFYQYFMEYIYKYVSKKCSNSDNGLDIHDKFCLSSFICQMDGGKSAIPGKLKYFNIVIDYSKCENFNDIWKQLVKNFDALFPKKTQGFNLNGSFENSVKMFTYIAPVWDNLSATFALRNKQLPIVSGGMSGGSSVSDSDIIKIFAGDYSLVPTNQPLSNSVNIDVISNFSSFNQLSNTRKLQASNFLINNRKRFNDILSEATQIVVNGLRFKLDDSNIMSAFESNQYAPTYARNVGFNVVNGMINDSILFANKLKSSFESSNIKTFDQAINFIVHNYIPLLNQFENRCNHKYGFSESKSILSKYAMDKVLNVIGVSSLIDTTYNVNSNIGSMSGGSQQPKIIEKRVEVPVVKEVEVIKEVPVSQDNDEYIDIDHSSNMIMEGGTSSEDLIKSLIEGQKKFNRAYEDIYRKLISALNSVNISNVQSQTFSKLYTVCNQFESIAIKSNKTTSFISGYYGAKNYNRLYTLCVENTIKAITEANVPSFNDVVKVLQDLKQLLLETAKNVQLLRTKFITAPKNISEMLIVASRDVKQPCSLTQKDFNALSDAIARIFNTIRTYTSETNVYNTKQQLENYLTKIEDRSKVINEHYDQIVLAFKNKFAVVFGGSRERDYAKDAWITLTNQKRDCMLYLNKVLDAKLTKERIDDLKNVNLSQQQIDNVEKAFLAFKNIQITPEFRKEMEKLAKALNPVSVGSIFKVIKKLKKLIIKSQYINFISQLYKELHIFNSEFNWAEFTDKITNLFVLSSIRIQPQYSFKGERYTLEGLCHKISYEFEKYFNSLNLELNAGSYPDNLGNSAYNFMMDHLKRVLSIYGNHDELPIPTYVNSLHDLAFPVNMYKDVFDAAHNAINAAIAGGAAPGGIGVAYHEDQAFIEYFITTNNIEEYKYFVDKSGQHIKPFNDVMGAPANGRIFTPSKGINPRNILESLSPILPNNVGQPDSDKIHNAMAVYFTFMSGYFNKLIEDDVKKTLPYYVKHLPLYIATIYFGSDNAVANNFYKAIEGNVERLPNYGVSVCAGDNELDIAKYAVDSLFANIVAVVDKYWSIKYNGIMPIPLNINMVLRGGNKQEGGTIFDSMPLHDQSFSSVIPEAVPFYICAFNICQYYIDTFNVKNVGSDPTLILNINKISVLYPIYELFGKYQARISTLTPNQMKTALAVFNEIWNQTQGNEASRLSRSIDLIFNELNACFIFTDKLQLEIIKSTNSLSKTAIDVISDKINILVKKMKDTLNSSVVEFNEDPESQAKRFESILNKAYNKVKNEPESQRLAKLKSMLVDDDKDGNLKDFYKFMELVISPMLISAKSYVQIFSLFDNYSFEADGANPNGTSIDFTEHQIFFKDPGDDLLHPKECFATVWEVIEKIKNGERPELKALFIEHPIVLAYNKLKLNEALDNFHKNGKFNLPNFWIVMDEHTYPSQSKIEFKIDQEYHRNDNIALMKQIWPTVQAKTVADYYNHCVSEFISDYDHFIHNFLSYPGLSDKTIKVISKISHDAIKIGNVSSKITDDTTPDSFIETGVYTLKDADNNLLANAKNLVNIPVTKSNNYIYPPPYSTGVIIPRFNDLTPVEELEIVEASTSENRSNVHVDGTGIYIKSSSARSDNITGCEFTWVDWVIFQIAKCDKTNFCIPYKLLQVIQDYPGLNIYLRQPGYDKKGSKQQYNRLSDGAYNNIVTQNILARSSSSLNKDKMEYATLNNSWIASLIAVTPYIINTLVAYKSLMNQNVTYNRNSVNQCLTNLIDALTMFYDDISNYAPFMPFMTDSVQISSSRVKPHIFGELLSFINNNNICNMDSSDFIKLEWANMWFFNGIDNISFPDYKNKDRFEWIKEFASDKINNGTFRSEFDTTIQTLGRNVWAGLIAKTSNYNVDFKNVYRELDEIIIKTINIMSECDTDIIQKYVNNIIDEYTLNMRTGISGHGLESGLSLAGGNEANKTEKYDIPENLKSFADRLTKGLVTHNVAEVKDAVDYSDVNAKPPVSSSKLYLYYEHVPKDIEASLKRVSETGTFNVKDMKFKSFEEIISSNGVNVIKNSIESIKTNYLSEVKGRFENAKSKLDELQSKFINYENEFLKEIDDLKREFRNGINSDIVTQFVICLPAAAAVNITFNDSITKVVHEFARSRHLGGTFNLGSISTCNIEIGPVPAVGGPPRPRIFDNTFNGDSHYLFIRWVERVIGYYQLIAVGLVFGLYKFYLRCRTDINAINGAGVASHNDFNTLVNRINTYTSSIVVNLMNILKETLANPNAAGGPAAAAGAMPKPITNQPRFEPSIVAAAAAVNHFITVNNGGIDWSLRDEYIARSKLVIKELMKLLTMPILNGKCKDIYFKMLLYRMDYSATPHMKLGTIGHAAADSANAHTDLNYTTKLAYCVSILKSISTIAYSMAQNSNKKNDIIQRNNELNNAIQTEFYANPPPAAGAPVNLNAFYTAIHNCNVELNTTTLYAINDGAVDNTGKITLKGGRYSDDKVEVILAIAMGIAKSVKNRSIYVDNTQNTDGFPLIIYKDGNVAPKEIYLYKYLYNPNLCSLFNKSNLSNIEYAISNAANSKLFIEDPVINLTPNDILDLSKIQTKLSPYFDKLFTKHKGVFPVVANSAGINNYPHFINIPFYNNFKDSAGNNLANNELQRYVSYFRRITFGGYHNIPNVAAGGLVNVTIHNIDGNSITVKASDLRLPQPAMNIPAAEFANDHVNNLIPGTLKVNYENSSTVISPKTHTVKIDDKMFAYIPYSKALSQHLFSPQKDIYNATLININQLASPTILQDINTKYLDFSRHIVNLHAMNLYTNYIGAAPTYSKDLSNYHNFQTNPIYNFIELLLKQNLRAVFDPNESLKFNNFGFDIGSVSSLSGRGLLGGYDISDSFSNRFVNVDSIVSGNNEMELLNSAYNIDGTPNIKSLSDGKLLYSYIFKSNFDGGGNVENCKAMFTLILNYFHKYNVSFNSMFNQLCYPSILFNASALRLSIERMQKLISKFSGSHEKLSDKSYKGKTFAAVESYISNYSDGISMALDMCGDYRYQVRFIDNREKFMTIQDIITNLQTNNSVPGFEDNKVLWMSNQYACPSIANNFLTEFVKYITIDTTENEEMKKVRPVQQLFATGISSVLRHLDSLSSFISTLFMLLKQTSYYDHEYDRDMTFFNVTNPEPFSVT